METTLKDIISKLKKELPNIKKRYNVSSLEIFGSYIHNQQRKNSDLDILVSFKKKPSLFKFIELENYLTELLGVKVDLVMKSSLKPNIGKKIISEAKSIL